MVRKLKNQLFAFLLRRLAHTAYRSAFGMLFRNDRTTYQRTLIRYFLVIARNLQRAIKVIATPRYEHQIFRVIIPIRNVF